MTVGTKKSRVGASLLAGGLFCLLASCSSMAFTDGVASDDDFWDEDEDGSEDAGTDDDDAEVECFEDDAGVCIVFPCQNGYMIPTDRVCDGIWDCEFGEDEDMVVCVDVPPEEVFTCDDGITFPYYFQCDDVPDCANGEDEVGCPVYGDGGHFCSSGYDLPDEWWCDDEPDCPEGEDEASCDLDAGAGDGGVDAGVDGGVDAGEEPRFELTDASERAR